MAYINVSESVDFEVDLDDYADDIPTKWLIQELKSRNIKELEYNLSTAKHPDNIDRERKWEIIMEHLHKFSYDEIHEIFTTKKY